MLQPQQCLSERNKLCRSLFNKVSLFELGCFRVHVAGKDLEVLPKLDAIALPMLPNQSIREL